MKTILISDDDSDTRAFINKVIEPLGHRVLMASSGREAIRQAELHHPDLLILDVLMPDGHGFEVCKELRGREEFAKTKILFLTSKAYAADRLQALELGANEYLEKPVLVKDLEDAIKALLVEQDGGAFQIKFWGVRGSIPTPGPHTIRYGGNTPCIEVRCGDTLFILDAGSGLRELGNSLMAKGKPLVIHLLISHTHWDHVQGFPFFAPLYVKGHSLHIYGCHGANQALESVLAGQMELPYFPIQLGEASANVHFHELDEGEFNIEDVHLLTLFTNHPGICLAYRLEWADKALTYLCDNEPHHQLASPHSAEHGPDLIGASPDSLDPRLARFAHDSDLLIVDCPYDADEYKQRRGWGHGCVDDVVQIALRAQVKRLALFHHDPSHTDDNIDAMVAHARALNAAAGGHVVCTGAQEGMEIEL